METDGNTDFYFWLGADGEIREVTPKEFIENQIKELESQLSFYFGDEPEEEVNDFG